MSIKDVMRIKRLEKFMNETEPLLDALLARVELLEEKENNKKPNGKNDRAGTARTSSG